MSDLRNKEMSPVKVILAGAFVLAFFAVIMGGLSHFGVISLPNGNPQFDKSTGEIIASTTESAPTPSQSSDSTETQSTGSQPQAVDPDMRDAIERAICMVMLPGPDITVPTNDFPFGGYEGYVFDFLVVNNLWESVDIAVHTDDACGVLTDAEHERLVLNLVNEARRQAGSDLNLTFLGQVVRVDLTLIPTRNGMATPQGEPAPSGSVIEPDGNKANGDFDGTPHSTNPQLGTSAPQQTETSGEVSEGDPWANSGNLGGNVEQRPSSRSSIENLPPVMGEEAAPMLPQMNPLGEQSSNEGLRYIEPFN